jgi:hypothetical protein
VFEASVDRLGGSVARARSVEVGEYVGGATVQGPAEGDQLSTRGIPVRSSPMISVRVLGGGAVGLTVGGDDALKEQPGRFDLDVRVVVQRRREPPLLLGGEQLGAGAPTQIRGDLADAFRGGYLATAVEWAVQPDIIQLLIEFDSLTKIIPAVSAVDKALGGFAWYRRRHRDLRVYLRDNRDLRPRTRARVCGRNSHHLRR